ncbi:TRAP transporter substrate-binding protein DctP [Ramlibacter sp.]|uniref:TRAP transporter substrate-binding protein DctP n=1 Tax=Ramlibacter sp. TaxID=1917967 RepID=UPI002FC909E6
MKRKWIPAACAAILAVAASTAVAETKLLFSTFFPAQHPLVKRVLQPWAANVQQATGGSVVVEFSPTSLAPPPGQLDMVSKGIADVTVQFAGVVPNRLTSLLVTEVPGPVSTSEAMSVALWRTHEKFLAKADEHKGVKLLSVFALPPQGIYGTRDEPITSIEQLKSAKIATTPGTAARAYGAVTSGVVAGPAVRYFELVSKGMVDAYVSVTPLDVVGFNLARYTRTGMTLPTLGTAGSFSLVMSESKWNKLTPAEQAAIAKVSGEAFARTMSALDTANKAAIKAMQDQGTKFVEPPPALVQDLGRAFAFLEKEWIAEVGKRGVDGAAAAEFYRAEQKRAGAGQ